MCVSTKNNDIRANIEERWSLSGQRSEGTIFCGKRKGFTSHQGYGATVVVGFVARIKRITRLPKTSLT